MFTIKAAENTPQGMNKNLICQVQVPEAGHLIAHNIGSGVLRVDPPPPKPKTPAPAAEGQPAPVAQATTPPKPLSRLEQLRKEQAEKDAAAAAGGM